MTSVPVRIPSLLGGVSRVAQNRRSPSDLQAADNVELFSDRGVDKRAGTEFIAGEGVQGELDYTALIGGVVSEVFVFWINRSADERFFGILNPNEVDGDVLQIYNLAGEKQVINGLTDVDVQTYLISNADALDPRLLFQTATIEDTTLIVNRTVPTALQGGEITYVNADGNLREKTNNQNITAWSDFAQPPATDDPAATLAAVAASCDDPDPVTITDNGLWYAQDDDVGQVSGFYLAISDTLPPWYQRVRTEEENSCIDETTMPLRLDWDGVEFNIGFCAWTDRLSGDSFTNPGPSFIGLSISDITFHQGRLWFMAQEHIVSSRLGDIFNLWVNSVVLQTQTDPVDITIQGQRFATIDFCSTFRETIVALTNGSRQVEVRANGPITPQTVQLFDSTAVFSASYVAPAKLGSQLYFAGERDFSNIIYEYFYNAEQVCNVATDLTGTVSGYIPAQASQLATSAAHDQLFVRTLAEPKNIYINQQEWSGQKKSMSAWYRWMFHFDLISIAVFDNDLYLLMFKEDAEDVNRLYLEKMSLGQPQQDTDGSPAQTLNYSVRVDRKIKIQGFYNAGLNTTTWVLPFEDANIDEVVLAATWDTDEVKLAGARLAGFTVIAESDSTTITIDGDYENNGDGNNAPAYIGRGYEASVTLSEQFYRSPDGQAHHGNLQLLKGKIRFMDASYFRIEVTPAGREMLSREWVVPFVGSTPLDSDALVAFGEFQFRIMSDARNVTLRLVNDSPGPAAWVDLDFWTSYTPGAYSPLR